MLRRFFILLVAACVSLQGAAALAMPYTAGKPADHSDHAAGKGHAHGSHVFASDHLDAAGAHDDNAASSVDCERCGLCQVAYSSAMHRTDAGLPAAPAPVHADKRFRVHVPEQLQRPPLAAA